MAGALRIISLMLFATQVLATLFQADLGASEYVDYKKLDAFNGKKCGRDIFHDWQEAESGFECSTKSTSTRSSTSQENGGQYPDHRRSKQRMSFGYEAVTGQFPFHAQLRWAKQNGSRQTCQAAIIHNDLLITAGHCVHDSSWSGAAYMGSLSRFNADKRGVRVEVKSSCTLKGYELRGEDSFNDIGLVKLAKPIDYTRFSQPICLDFSQTHWANATCASAGHGFSSNYQETYETLHAMPYKVYTGPTNDTRQDRTYYIAAHPTWAGNACPGDSGSALVCYDNCSKDRTRGRAVGVVIDGPKYACIRGKPVPVQVADFFKLREALEELFKRCLNGETSVANNATARGRPPIWTNYDLNDEVEEE